MSRRPVLAAAALASVALLSACGTGLHNVTYREQGRMDGAGVDVGGRQGIAVRDLHVEPPAGGDVLPAGSTAVVTGGVSNNGTTTDALVGATSPVAAAATLTVGGEPVTSIPITSLHTLPLDWAVQLTGLRTALHAAQYVEVTLVFEHAGRVTLRVPVRAGDTGLSGRTPEQDPHGEG